MKLLPYKEEAFAGYRDASVQEFRLALSEQIREQVFYVNLAQNIETRIKSNVIANALKHLCWKRREITIRCIVKWVERGKIMGGPQGAMSHATGVSAKERSFFCRGLGCPQQAKRTARRGGAVDWDIRKGYPNPLLARDYNIRKLYRKIQNGRTRSRIFPLRKISEQYVFLH